MKAFQSCYKQEKGNLLKQLLDPEHIRKVIFSHAQCYPIIISCETKIPLNFQPNACPKDVHRLYIVAFVFLYGEPSNLDSRSFSEAHGQTYCSPSTSNKLFHIKEAVLAQEHFVRLFQN